MTAPTQEGACDHLATKADMELVRVDLERVSAELRAELERNRVELERLRACIERGLFRLGVALISAAGVIAGIVVAIIKLT